MGLSFVRKIVDAHGGRVWASSNGEGGAEFVFRLPQVKSKRRAG